MNWKQILWIVIYATIVVLVRHNCEIPNWVWWVVAIVFVIVFELLSTKKTKKKTIANDSKSSDQIDYQKEKTTNNYRLGDNSTNRYYLYNNCCSFLLPSEEINNKMVEKDGLKHTIFTKSMFMIIIEIRNGMPNFPWEVESQKMKVAGFNCLAAKVGPLADDYNHYYIDCKKFVVQVSFTIVSDETKRFINSFKLES